VADTWIELGRVAVNNQIPDATGFDVEVRAECRHNGGSCLPTSVVPSSTKPAAATSPASVCVVPP
jgi:hypothetical protein